ncbi:MAG TPA: thymidine phosphorylase [Verrucomicrobiae bacterium]|nr:thymidine phosphorylase [Verrucomicrobiae bacterium]
MRAVDLIRKKRDGGEHSAAEINSLIESYTCGETPDYQMSAWMMALLWRGATPAEAAALTGAMLRSGSILDLSALPGPKVDKHSTGGVGDKTSLILAPIAAAGGLIVPMISGRGLGHTGGTLDKLEAIPGFDVGLTAERFLEVLRQTGCGITGQTAEIAPADKKMYALRDVTATVESEALICASIMSKKLAEGIDALVLDVKTGSGAFMRRTEDAESLARTMVAAGERMGKRMAALLTDMDQPLGRAVGNALEVAECVEILEGARDPMSEDLRALSIELAAWMFFLGGKTSDVAQGKALAEEKIRNGEATRRFRAMVQAQGGEPDFTRLPAAQKQAEFKAATAGSVTAVACEQVGLASLALGGGRGKKEDVIDHAVGLTLRKKVGDSVRAGETIATVHYNDPAKLPEALALLQSAYHITSAPPRAPRVLVQKVICQQTNQL